MATAPDTELIPARSSSVTKITRPSKEEEPLVSQAFLARYPAGLYAEMIKRATQDVEFTLNPDQSGYTSNRISVNLENGKPLRFRIKLSRGIGDIISMSLFKDLALVYD